MRAKSMFDEPVRLGLIRFADAHDHPAGQLSDFDASHQPLLVLYSSPLERTATNETSPAS